MEITEENKKIEKKNLQKLVLIFVGLELILGPILSYLFLKKYDYSEHRLLFGVISEIVIALKITLLVLIFLKVNFLKKAGIYEGSKLYLIVVNIICVVFSLKYFAGFVTLLLVILKQQGIL